MENPSSIFDFVAQLLYESFRIYFLFPFFIVIISRRSRNFQCRSTDFPSLENLQAVMAEGKQYALAVGITSLSTDDM